jgi:hypothetical protein
MNNALFIDKEPHTKLNKNFPLELRTKTKRMKEELVTLQREDKLKPYQEEQLSTLKRAISRFSAENDDNQNGKI